MKLSLLSLFLLGNRLLSEASKIDNRYYHLPPEQQHDDRLLQQQQDDSNIHHTCVYFFDRDDDINNTNNQTTIPPENQVLVDATAPRPLCDSEGEGPEMCCSYDARQSILNGNSGGFSVEYAFPIIRGNTARSQDAATCYAYMDALSDTICSPQQGQYINDNTFHVCEDSCNAVYDACKDVIHLPDNSVNDGKSFCYDAWNSKCDNDEEDDETNIHICEMNLQLDVVATGDDNCLSIISPTDDVITVYVSTSASQDACAPVVTTYVWVGSIVLGIVILLCCGLVYFVSQQQIKVKKKKVSVAPSSNVPNGKNFTDDDEKDAILHSNNNNNTLV